MKQMRRNPPRSASHSAAPAVPTHTCVLVYHPERGAALSVQLPNGNPHPAFAKWSVMGKIRLTYTFPMQIAPGQSLPPGFVAANPERQRAYGIGGPKLIYAPIVRNCQSCHKEFQFSVDEQRYWYEELGFCIDSTATRCQPCRRAIRHITVAEKRWAAALNAWDDAERRYLSLSPDTPPPARLAARKLLAAAATDLFAAGKHAQEVHAPIRVEHLHRARGRLVRSAVVLEGGALNP